MAELASGAVSSLLGVIRNEAALLGGVRGDVQFIKEEMESMNSFLLYLARTASPDGDHDEQVRTWMNQVRLLAGDCNNCIDLYLYRGNPEIHLPKGRLQRYLRWTPWFLQRMVAQHRAALKLRELKDRARDVGERRLRYGVEVPAKALQAAAATAAGQLTTPAAAAAAEDMDDQVVATAPEDRYSGGPRGALFGLGVVELEDYFKGKLAKWILQFDHGNTAAVRSATTVPSIAIVVATDNPAATAGSLAHEASLAAARTTHFKHSVLVDIPAVHFPITWLRPVDVLCYMWRYLERLSHSQQQEGSSQGQGKAKQRHIHWQSKGRWGIYHERSAAILQIMRDIRDVMKVDDKIEDIKRKIRKVKADQLQLDLEKMTKKQLVRSKISDQPLAVLLLLLKSAAAGATSVAVAEQQPEKKTEPALATWYEDIIDITSKKLKDHMEAKQEVPPDPERMIVLDDPKRNYASILREVFPGNSSNSQQKPHLAELQSTDRTAKTATATALGEEQIKEMIQKAKQEILHEVHSKLDALHKLQEGKTDREQATARPGSQDQITEAVVAEESTVKTAKIQGQASEEVATEETMDKTQEKQDRIPETDIAEITHKIREIKHKIEEQMMIKRILDKIQSHLKKEKTLVILRIHGTGWEETRNTFHFLGCVSGAVIITTLKNTQRAKQYCNPLREPMEYSVVGLYHDIVLQLTRKQMNEEGHGTDSKVLRDILEECQPHEFCMKIFAHALYAKPKRSIEELHKLHTSLKAVSAKSFPSIAEKMFKFSYNDLQKEYRSCLLYLAIFPPGHKIRRSTLIGRWVVEGLITTEDWLWSSSVHKAKICFDELIDRWLVYPTDISATGERKSCMVGDQVHELITKVAEKQHIVETRLSNHLARHFSISNDLRLRGSDKIEKFFQQLSESSRFCLLKVLDLEGCQCFGTENKRYLKVICCKIKLLKYLSLRRTDVIHMPNEINKLHELEVLDIRQTSVPECSTRNIRLLKLKRLLAGHMDPNNSVRTISIEIPEKIENMDGMEVLSSVKPRNSQDLIDIGKLWRLRKLGVVIEDKESHLKSLIQGISDLNACIQSLSITLVPQTRHKYTPCKRWLLPGTNIGSNNDYRLEYRPKLLESLNITGTGSTDKVKLLDELLDKENSQLTKITLRNTLLSQADLEVLSKLPMLSCVKLQCNSYAENKLTFKKGEFTNLKYFLIEGSKMTEIIFDDGATSLEKMVLPLSDGLKFSGLDKLLGLEELELNDNNNKSNSSTTSSSNNNINSSGNNNVNDINTNSITTAIGTDTVAAAPTNDTTTIAAHTATAAVALNSNSTDATVADVAAGTAAVASANASTTNTKTTTIASTTGTDTIAAAATHTNMAAGTAATTAPTDSNIIKNNMLHLLFDNAKRITKVTLRGTMLKQDGLQILAKKPNIHCLLLLNKSYDESQLTFEKEDFPKLNLLTVECSNITKINFTAGSCPKLEKFIWTFAFAFTNMEPLTGIVNLLRLKEVEFNGEFVHDEVKEEIKRHKNRPYFTHYKPEKRDHKLEGNMVQQPHGTKFSCFQRDKGLRQKRN